MRLLLLTILVCYASAQTTIVIAPSTQSGPFLEGHDVYAINPHSYRPNEFFANDFVFEGLVAWDPDSAGADGKKGTSDDGVVPSLASSWSITNTDDGMKITFKLKENVKFHDGADWDADAASVNFDHILGGKTRSRAGFHDWYGLGSAMKSWKAVDKRTFEVTFFTYYEPALRELSVIRPFRMSSPRVLPSIDEGYLSCNDFKKFAPRIHGVKGGGYPNNPIPGKDRLTCNGVRSPVGTGPYKVVHKLIKSSAGGTRLLPAAKFNESCWQGGNAGNGAPNCKCTDSSPSAECLKDNEFVKEIKFEKFDGHRASPAYDVVIVRSYKDQEEIKTALIEGTLDMVYGVGALSPSSFIRLSTQEGSNLKAHRAPHVINTRSIVLNSLGALNTPAKRKAVMGIIDREPLIEGELADEKRAETLFDPEMPYCDIAGLKSIKDLAAQGPAPTTDIASRPLRFIYKKDVPHESIIASKVVADLYAAGIQVQPIVLSKDDYNAAMNSWIGGDGEARTDDDATTDSLCETNPPVSGETGCVSFDIAYSETWGPPYDPTSKLFDMTYEWGSGEADAVATINLEAMEAGDFKAEVRRLSTITDDTERQAAYTKVITMLHNEAVFLPLTRKKNIAVVNDRVSGFKFGSMEFDIPIASLHPTPPPVGMIIGIVFGALAVLGLLACVAVMIVREKQGAPIFMEVPQVPPEPMDLTGPAGNLGHAMPMPFGKPNPAGASYA